jgi:hypothetical protein
MTEVWENFLFFTVSKGMGEGFLGAKRLGDHAFNKKKHLIFY